MTLEYYNDPKTGELGDYFLCEAQNYFIGYLNQARNGFFKWWIIDMVAFREAIMRNGGVSCLLPYLKSNKKSGKASFFAIPINKLRNAIVHSYEDVA
jgi:hypothetical protein